MKKNTKIENVKINQIIAKDDSYICEFKVEISYNQTIKKRERNFRKC